MNFYLKLVICMSVKWLVEIKSLRNTVEWYIVLNREDTQFLKHFTEN